MNVIVIHGDFVSQSTKRLLKFIELGKKQNREIIRIEGGTSFSENLLKEGLFQKERLVVLEKPMQLRKSDFDWLNKNHTKIYGSLIIYYPGKLPKEFITRLPRQKKIEEFKLPASVFNFLDSLYPGNARQSLKILHNLLSSESIEFIMALTARHLRDLYLAKISPSRLQYESWRISKLKKQASFFSEQLIKKIIKELSEIDAEAKRSDVNIADSLDLLITTQLE